MQIARIASHGRQRSIATGEVLVEAGQRPVPFFVVLSGEVQVLRPSAGLEALIVRQGAGQLTGESTLLTGRRALARIQAVEPGAVIELDREQLLGLIQTDAELSETLMRAFILRRVELISGGYGDVVLIGSTHCAGTLPAEEPGSGVSCRHGRARPSLGAKGQLGRNDVALPGFPNRGASEDLAADEPNSWH